MKGVVFVGDRKIEFQEFPDPTPGPRDVIIEIKASGMCGSDLHLYRASGDGPAIPGLTTGEPTIGGHEPCGVIVEVGGAVTPSEAVVGQRVMDHHYEGCGTCRHCRTGWNQMCDEGATVFGINGHGAHAPYMKVPVGTVVPLREELSFEVGAAISCGTGTAFGALNRLQLRGDETIAIFGQGPVGLSATMLAASMGARVIAVDVLPQRCEMARKFGAHDVINPTETDPIEAINALTRGEGAHKTLDCTSSAEARLAAVRSTRAWGTACMVGVGGNLEMDVARDLIFRQIGVIGSWTFSTTGQVDCANYVAERKLPVNELFSDRWKLEQADEAYRHFDQQATGKGVFLL
ncbi:MAG: zinc-binding dehydrogenase [Gammaproteobacteria bacterium]|nr:zinc-binding dehydrogenase [Gammaproteobacteria bacterium]